jgi:hypothetical protein
LGGFVTGGAQMQKACGIIAIVAIALGASQLASIQKASAQTSDPSRRTADGPSAPAADPSSTTRDEVRAKLEEAGFSNIQIMSESFLVRAIGPDGSPVVMVVHPDSQAMTPEASDDQDAANAREAGDADALGDLSEDDEEDAVAPAPPDHRSGKSAKTMDRAPAADSNRAEGRQGAANSAMATDRRESAVTERQPQSNSMPNQVPNQVPSQVPNQTQSQSAKMRDEGLRQSADNQTPPGRPNGMAPDMKESEQRALDLSNAQRAEIWKQLGNQQATNAPPGFQPKVGATVPASMQLRSLPNSLSSEVPQVQSYNYAMVQSQLLIVDPATNRIVSIITE